MKPCHRQRAMLAGCTALCLLGARAHAADNGKIEEITVTSQKRRENIQRVPISITKIGSETLAKQGVLKTDDLQVAVPGLLFEHEIDEATVFIRGIGPTSNSTGEESSVAVYLDDLYIPSGNAAIFALNAVSGIEVLKGPQGTLFGRNATGGVIQVRTNDPTFHPQIDAHAGYGNYNTSSGDLYASGTIIPGLLAGNVAVFGSDQADGWGRNVATGAKAFTSSDYGARVKLLLTPAEGTRVKLSLAHFYTQGEIGLGLNQVPDQAPIPGYLPPPTGAKYVGFYNTATSPNDVSIIQQDLAELRIDQETRYAKIVSITGWQQFMGSAQFNQDGNGLLQTRLGQSGRTFSEEVQLLNPDNAPYASRFKWIVGAFAEHDKSGYTPAQLGGPALGAAPGDLIISLRDMVTTKSYAGFAQGTVEVLPGTHITLGARYSRDQRQFEGGVYLAPAFPVPALVGQPSCAIGLFACPTAPGSPGSDKTWDLQTYRAAVDQQITKDILVYFAFNRGIKSGEFDTFGAAEFGVLFDKPVAPEVLYSYEIGLKSELLDHTLRLNAAAFRYNISNLQLIRIVSGATELLNAAGATVDGLEVNVEYKPPIRNLTLSGGLSAQYGYYTSFANAPTYFTPSQTFDATGKQTVHTPKLTFNIAADYVIPRPFGDFDLNANLTHTSTFQWFADGTLPQPQTNIFNASVMWTSPSRRYDARFWASNILGEKYYAFGSESSGLGKEFSPAAPATFGFTVGYHFF